MDQNDVELIDKKTVFQGYFRVDRYRLRHRLFRGGWSEVMQREVFERGHAVAVLPFDPETGKLVLIEQFRAGVYAHGGAPWQIEIIAGIIGEGESKPEVVRREALEEAGCELIGAPLKIMEYYMSPGAVSEHMTLYCAKANLENVGGIHGIDEEHEDIRVMVMDLAEALKLLEQGKIFNSPTIIALQWLALNRGQLEFHP